DAGEVASLSCAEIIEDAHRLTAGKQAFDKMRADETRPSGDQTPGHSFSPSYSDPSNGGKSVCRLGNCFAAPMYARRETRGAHCMSSIRRLFIWLMSVRHASVTFFE